MTLPYMALLCYKSSLYIFTLVLSNFNSIQIYEKVIPIYELFDTYCIWMF